MFWPALKAKGPKGHYSTARVTMTKGFGEQVELVCEELEKELEECDERPAERAVKLKERTRSSKSP